MKEQRSIARTIIEVLDFLADLVPTVLAVALVAGFVWLFFQAKSFGIM